MRSHDPCPDGLVSPWMCKLDEAGAHCLTPSYWLHRLPRGTVLGKKVGKYLNASDLLTPIMHANHFRDSLPSVYSLRQCPLLLWSELVSLEYAQYTKWITCEQPRFMLTVLGGEFLSPSCRPQQQ